MVVKELILLLTKEGEEMLTLQVAVKVLALISLIPYMSILSESLYMQ